MRTPEAATLRFATMVVSLLIIGVGALLSTASGLSNDQNSIFQGAYHLLVYGDLYTHWIDVNPPLIYALYTLPVALTMKSGLPPSVAVHGCAAIVCLASLLLIWRTNRHELSALRQWQWLLIAGALFFFAGAGFHIFADRDFLLFAFATPWLICRLLGIRPSFLVIAFAAVGFCLKPYNLLICAAMLLFGGPAGERWREKFFSRSSFIIGGFAVSYLMMIRLFSPAYIHDVLPLALTTYNGIEKPLSTRLFTLTVLFAIEIFVLKAVSLSNVRRSCWALIASSAAVFLLNGGWFYTIFVLVASFMLALLAQAQTETPLREEDVRYLHRCRRFCAAGLLAMVALSMIPLTRDITTNWREHDSGNLSNVSVQNSVAPDLAAVIGPRFILLSSYVWASTLEGPHMRPFHVFDYDVLWPLPWIVAHPDDPRSRRFTSAIDLSLLRALRTPGPLTIVFDVSPAQRRLPENFSFLQFFLANPLIAREFKNFGEVKNINVCRNGDDWKCHYIVWRKAV